MTEYQERQRAIALTRWIGYKTSKRLNGLNSRQTAYDRAKALQQIQFVKKITGKQRTDRDYQPDIESGIRFVMMNSSRRAA
jgi:hypothetical protein